MNRINSRNDLERRLIALAALGMALYDAVLSMFRVPLDGIGQTEGVVPGDLIQGSRFALVLIAVVLILVSPGLWHGKRLAWLIAVGCAAASVMAHPLKEVDVWGTGASLLLLGALLGARPQFPARSDPPSAKRGLFTLLLGGIAMTAYSVSGLYFQDDDFHRAMSLTRALRETLPLVFLFPASQAQPVTAHGAWFIDSVRLGFLFVAALGTLQLLRPVIFRSRVQPQDRERVRRILEKGTESPLAFFMLLPDKDYFFSARGNAVLAYRVQGNTAVVLGDPAGSPGEFDELLSSFAEHCDLNGWTFAFLQARPELRQVYGRMGWKCLKTGEEAYVDVRSFTLSGTSQKHLRATMNRFQREGYSVKVLTPPYSRETLESLRRVSDEWLAHGRRRERRFTMGWFDRSALQECDVLVAQDAGGTVAGFATIVPSFGASAGNFDLLRYRSEPKDLADFLTVSLIEHFRERGFERMTLGLAPFSGDQEDAAGPTALAMKLLYSRGSVLMRYQGLRDYKSKYASDWEPRYLVYPAAAQLPGIALAAMRVAEFPVTAGLWKPQPQPLAAGAELGLASG